MLYGQETRQKSYLFYLLTRKIFSK
jgi:hypothetical protein